MFNPHLSFADQISIQLSLPRKWQLGTRARELVEKLEGLLAAGYPNIPPAETEETLENPEVKDIAKMLIGYCRLRFGDMLGHDVHVLKWLGLTYGNLPLPCVILENLETSQGVAGLCSYGLFNDPAPALAVTASDGHGHDYILPAGRSEFGFSGDTIANYILRASDVLQAQVIVKTRLYLHSGLYGYDLDWNLGNVQVESAELSAANAFSQPVDMCFIVYNARGGNLHSFKVHLDGLMQLHHPMAVIITETRHGFNSAQRLAARIGCNQVETLDPVPAGGGVWVMTNTERLSMQIMARNPKQLRINFLRD